VIDVLAPHGIGMAVASLAVLVASFFELYRWRVAIKQEDQIR
jgi:hypothetical protein